HLHSFVSTPPATPETHALSLHDALPIWQARGPAARVRRRRRPRDQAQAEAIVRSRAQAWLDRFVTWSPVLLLGALAALTYWLNADRKSTRLNSSHVSISYAVFCLKKKKT